MDMILRLMIPYRRVSDFAPYFNSYAVLHQNKNQRNSVIYWKAIGSVLALQLNVLGWIIHYILLVLLPHSDYLAWMHLDSIQIFGIKPEWLRLTYPPILFMVIYFTHQIYFSIETRLVERIRLIFMNQDKSFFIPPFWFYKGKIASVYVQQITIKYLNMIQILTFVSDVALVIIQVSVSHHLIVNGPLYFSTSKIDYRLGVPLVMICFELRFISGIFLLFQLSFTITMLIVLSTILLASNLVRFWQTRQILRRILTTKSQLINAFLDRFMIVSRETILRLIEANRFIGKMWFVFLLINYPISCIVIVQVLFGSMDPFPALCNAVMFGYQLFFIFILHLGIVLVNRQIILPNRDLMHISLHRQSRINRINKLRLSHYLQAFHTKRNYGITYYKFGLVSLGTFTKCIFFYFELLMYAYMMINNKK